MPCSSILSSTLHQLQVRRWQLAKLGAAAEDEGLVAAGAAWRSGPRGPESVPMHSARSVAAGSSVLVAPRPAVASVRGRVRWRRCVAASGFCCGLWRADGASVSPFVVLRVALIEGGAVLLLSPKGVVWCWWAVCGDLPLSDGQAAGCCVRCCAVLAGPASPAEQKRPAVLG